MMGRGAACVVIRLGDPHLAVLVVRILLSRVHVRFPHAQRLQCAGPAPST